MHAACSSFEKGFAPNDVTPVPQCFVLNLISGNEYQRAWERIYFGRHLDFEPVFFWKLCCVLFVVHPIMGLARQAYNTLFRRSSTFMVTIFVGAFVFERVFDDGMDRLWERMNQGVSHVLVFLLLALKMNL